MTSPWEVMVVSSDLEIRNRTAAMLARQGVSAICASTLGQCTRLLKSRKIGLVFCDCQLSDGNYQDILARIGYSASPKVVVMSAEMSPEERDQAKGNCVFDIIPAPYRSCCIGWMVVSAKRALPAYANNLEGVEMPTSVGDVEG